MIELRKSTAEEVPELQELFRLCFGDGPDYSGQYFDHFYRPDEFFSLRDDGALRAMGGLLNVTLCEPGGQSVKAAYLYALATHPDHRGKGYAGTILNYADFYLRGKRDCLLTVPAQPQLHPFFRQKGFSPFAPLLEGTPTPRAPRPGERACPVDGAEYEALRETLLAQAHHVSYGALTGLQKRLSDCCSGALLSLDVDGAPGCAAAELRDDGVLIKELLIAPEALEGGLALVAAAVPGGQYVLRLGAGGANPLALPRRDFALIKWYDPIAAKRWVDATPYLGLAFD